MSVASLIGAVFVEASMKEQQRIRKQYKHPLPPNLTTEECKQLDRQVGGGHYKDLKIQPIEYILSNKLGWCEGNCVKYVTRYSIKGGKEDIEKAIHYLQILLEQLDG